jgi:16S rRNA (uracil1498-N3)-methyltransferase
VSSTGWAAAIGARALCFVDALPDGSSSYVVDGPDGHHLQRVRRLTEDESLVLADGAGGWVPARVVHVRDGALEVAVTGERRDEPAPTPELTVAFAPAKRDHGTEVTHQLVELGVDRIVPLQTERGVVRWDGDRGAKQLERLRRVAREAAMQSHRARVPEVTAPATPATLATSATRRGVLVADPHGVALSRAALPDVDVWVALVGPEGGFAPAELDALDGAVRVAIGPHVLRAVTAPVAVAAALGVMRTSV